MKFVPDTAVEAAFAQDRTIRRPASGCLMSQLDEYAVEQALRLRDALPRWSVSVLTERTGPHAGSNTLRRGRFEMNFT